MKNFKTLASVFLLTSYSCFGQLDFAEYVITEDSMLPELVRQIEVADLDGDGDVDLITASAVDDKIAWFENKDGNGSFGDQKIVSTEIESAQYVGHGDIDGDGDIDLIVPDKSDNKLIGFINDGNGVFDEIELLTSDSQLSIEPQNLRVGDVDADGKVDIVFYDDVSTDLLLFRNIDNEGNFARESVASISAQRKDFELGDIDGDGDLDIVSGGLFSSSEGLRWHEYVDGQYLSHDIELEDVYNQIEIADMDADGDLDIIVGSSFSAATRLAWIEFDDEFTNVNFLSDEPISIRSLEVADINQDGYPNVIYDHNQINGLNWIENATGEGPRIINIITQANALNSSIIFAHDVNEDGFSDLITEGQNLHIKWFYYLPNTNEFSDAFTVPSKTHGPIDAFSMDVDEDGDLDIVSISAYNGVIEWFENLGLSNGFSKTPVLIYDHDGFLSRTFQVDVDEDGDQDMIAYSRSGKSIFWIRNEGNAIFSDEILIDDFASYIDEVDIGDLDKDGDMDIVISYSTHVLLYENIGGFDAFQFADTIYSGIPLDVTLLRDLDGDQDLDLIIRGCCNDASTYFLENMDGLGTLDDPVSIIPDGEYNSLFETIDVDADGDLDICIGAFFVDGTYVLINQDGNFDSEYMLSEYNFNAMTATDIDLDGDLDIVASTWFFSANEFVWLEKQDGFLNYTSHLISDNEVTGGSGIEVTDMDNDGDLDILASFINEDKIALYNNYDPLSTSDIPTFQFTVSPVPATTSLQIESEVVLDKALIYNIEGRFQFLSHDVSNIDVSSLIGGMYIIEVFDVDGNKSALKFVK